MSNGASRSSIILKAKLSIITFPTDSTFNFLCLIILCGKRSSEKHCRKLMRSTIISRSIECADFSWMNCFLRIWQIVHLSSASFGRMSNVKIILFITWKIFNVFWNRKIFLCAFAMVSWQMSHSIEPIADSLCKEGKKDTHFVCCRKDLKSWENDKYVHKIFLHL